MTPPLTPEQLAEYVVDTVCNNVIVANSKHRIIKDTRQMWVDEIGAALRQVKRETWEEAAQYLDDHKRDFPLSKSDVAGEFRRRSMGR